MKSVVIVLSAIAVAAPVSFIPTASDAQVLVGRGAARSSAPRAPRRPRLTAAEQDRLWAAQDEVDSLTQQVQSIEEEARAAGAMTAAQTSEIESLRARIATTQQELDALRAKRDRR